MPIKPLLDAEIVQPPGSSQLKLTIERMNLAQLTQLLQAFGQHYQGQQATVHFVVQRIHGSPAAYLAISPTKASAE